MLLASFAGFGQTGNLLENSSFEEGAAPWAVEQWAVEQGQKHTVPAVDEKMSQGSVGSRSLRFDQKEGYQVYLPYRKPIQLPKALREYTLSCWIKSAGYEKSTKGQHILRAEFYTADRKKNQVKMVSSEWNKLYPEWTELTATFTIPEEFVTASLVFHIATHGNKNGVSWLDNVYLGPSVQKDQADVSGKIVIEKGVHTAKHGGIYYPGELPAYEFFIRDGASLKGAALASWEILDFDGKPVRSGKSEIPLGTSFKMQFPLPEDFRGYYVLKLDLSQNGGSIAKGEYSGIVVEPQQGERDPFFATKGCSSLEKHVRMGFGTRNSTAMIIDRGIETAPGVYNFRWIDDGLKSLQNAGYKNIYGVIILSNIKQPQYNRKEILEKLRQGIDPCDDRYFEEFRKFCQAVIARYGNVITDWCVPDEITLLKHDNKFVYDHYVRSVRIFAGELKKQFPKSTFAAGGETLTEAPSDETKTLIWDKIKDCVDGLSSDAYPQQISVGVGMNYLGPEQLNLRERFLQTERIIGPDKYYINEETGSGIQRNLTLDSPELREFAVINARILIVAKSVHCIRRWTWFLVEDAPSAWNGIFDYAMWKHFNPRPHAATYALATRMLAFARNAVEVKPHKDVYCYVFERRGKTLFALWAVTKERIDAGLDLPADWSGMDLMGKRFGGKKGTVHLKINDRPVFIELDAPRETVAERIRNGQYAMPEIYPSLNRQNAETVLAHIQNKTHKELSVVVEMGDRKQEVRLAPLARMAVPFASKARNGAEISARFTVNGITHAVKWKDVFHPVKRLAKEPAMDGTLAGFAGVVEPIVMDTSVFLKPLDAEAWGYWKNKDDLSCRLYLGYDAKYFYIAADVTDDVPISRASDDGIWNQDCIQYAFDTANNAFDLKTSPGCYEEDDREFCMALTPKGPQNFCYTGPKELAMKPFPDKVNIRIMPDGHKFYEARIPWSALGRLKPESGTVFGFNITLFDVDTPQGQASYHMELSPGIANGKNPAFFKRFMLE